MKNVSEIEVIQYLRGYAYGLELYPPDVYIHSEVSGIRTPFQEGYWRGAFEYFCLLTGALPDEIV